MPRDPVRRKFEGEMIPASELEADKTKDQLGCVALVSFVLMAFGAGIAFGVGGLICGAGLWLTIAAAGASIERAVKGK